MGGSRSGPSYSDLPATRIGGEKSADDCYFDFHTQVDGIKKTILDSISVGSVLRVRTEIVPGTNFKSVVCEANNGVLGSLIGFVGLAKLISCLERGNQYKATVTKKERGSCTVRVQGFE